MNILERRKERATKQRKKQTKQINNHKDYAPHKHNPRNMY